MRSLGWKFGTAKNKETSLLLLEHGGYLIRHGENSCCLHH